MASRQRSGVARRHRASPSHLTPLETARLHTVMGVPIRGWRRVYWNKTINLT